MIESDNTTPQSSQSPRRQVPREEISEVSPAETGGEGQHREDAGWVEREDAIYRAIDEAAEKERVEDVRRKGRLRNAWTRCRVVAIYVASGLLLSFSILLVVSLGAYYFTPLKWLDEEQIEFIHNAFGKLTLVFAAFVFGAKSRDFLSLIRDTFSD